MAVPPEISRWALWLTKCLVGTEDQWGRAAAQMTVTECLSVSLQTPLTEHYLLQHELHHLKGNYVLFPCGLF